MVLHLLMRFGSQKLETSLPKPILNVTNLSWNISGKAILSDISFSISPGEFVGIIGPNGAGKSSLLRNLYQYCTPSQGSINFQHKDLQQYTARQLAQQLAVVVQQANPVFALTVLQLVGMGIIPHKKTFSRNTQKDKEQIVTAIQQVGLADKAEQLFSHLSGGEQQRAYIARALVQKARLLLLDEPTNHLDIYYQHQTLQLIKSLQITVLLTIHDLNMAAQYCDRLLIMKQGRLVADGTPEQVMTSEILEPVFKLPCSCELDTKTGRPKVDFYGAEVSRG